MTRRRLGGGILAAVLLAALTAACIPDPIRSPPIRDAGVVAAPHNVLVLLADDIGLDSLALYPEANSLGRWPRTPNLERLAAAGVVFRNTWSSPTCSPTRASILTGRYPYRHGVTNLVEPRGANPLPLDELTLPQALDRIEGLGASHAAFGKWHLSNCLNGGAAHPNLAGFTHYSGMLTNTRDSLFEWPKTVDGKTTTSRTYATSANVTDAASWIRTAPEPWFVYLAFNAAHWPWEIPPHELLPGSGEGLDAPGTSCRGACREAMIEAMDREIGRLWDAVGEARSRTTVIFLGDNGTAEPVRPEGSPYPRGHFKPSLYEGGVNVPLIVAGASVTHPGRRSDALVHVSDVFSTSLELIAAGRSVDAVLSDRPIDGRSLVPILRGATDRGREFLFTQKGREELAVRDDRFKLIRHEDGSEEMYDLGGDDRFSERRNLLPAVDGDVRRAHLELGRRIAAIRAEASQVCPPVARCADCCVGPSVEACAAAASNGADVETCADSAEPFTEEDTGRRRCLQRDGSYFECDAGTIRYRQRPCTGPPDSCVSGQGHGKPRRSRTLVCR